MWRNKPLLRREGDKIFKTGQEAVQLLNSEAVRKDAVLNTIDRWIYRTSLISSSLQALLMLCILREK